MINMKMTGNPSCISDFALSIKATTRSEHSPSSDKWASDATWVDIENLALLVVVLSIWLICPAITQP